MIRDCIGIAGLGAVAYGVNLISHPCAVIFVGAAMVLCALFAPERKKKADR